MPPRTTPIIVVQTRYQVRKIDDAIYEVHDFYTDVVETQFATYKEARQYTNARNLEYFRIVKWAIQPTLVEMQLDLDLL